MNPSPSNRTSAPEREKRLVSLLGERAERYTVRCFSQIDSTNTEAKRMALSGESRALLLAERQSAGRGRMGRDFYSPTGGLYCSILCPVEGALASVVSLTGAAAVAVRRAIKEQTGIETAIKWVNDLYLGDRKVAGILAEALTVGTQTCLVIGIGVNLTATDFPAALSGIACSLMTEGLTPEALFAAILRELEPFLDRPESREWLADYRRHSCVIGREVRYTREGRTFTAIAEDVGADGELIVRASNGTTDRLRTGEITVRLAD